MSKMEYMPVDCLQVPKVLFQMEKYKNLSNTAKILYSLFLDRLKFAVQNGWVDHNGDLFVIYPKSEMKKDLNTTRCINETIVVNIVFLKRAFIST